MSSDIENGYIYIHVHMVMGTYNVSHEAVSFHAYYLREVNSAVTATVFICSKCIFKRQVDRRNIVRAFRSGREPPRGRLLGGNCIIQLKIARSLRSLALHTRCCGDNCTILALLVGFWCWSGEQYNFLARSFPLQPF